METKTVAETTVTKEAEHSNQEDRLRSSSVSSPSSVKSASSEFSFEDPYQLDINDHGSFALDNEQSSKNAPGSASTIETAPAQVMEQPPDESGYRIPSRVFASNKSGTPNQDWSTASNESLFSIHTGNMSFTRDQFNWLLKSGELGMYGPGAGPGDIRKSGELPPPSPRIVLKPGEQKPKEQMAPMPPPVTPKSGEQIIANHFKPSATPPPVVNRPPDVEVKSSPKVNEAAVTPDPKPVVTEKKKGRTVSDEIPPSAGASPHHSDASGQSFAFPVLAQIERDKSVNSGQSRAEPKNTSDPEKEGPKTPTSAASPAPASSSWLSYFSCCFRR
ncbi:uncharacterized protein LOC141601475 [Silene latifolia]|uniref:uncharacterized protein LOC141601475 n=1 Tax=Silene latifolia TaxID=37657 RepID=UPI003D77D6AB